MRVLLCNERFLFRFGADRVLILLGQGLAERGHTVTLMANRYDRSVIGRFASNIIDVPEPSGRYFHLNEDTAEWLRANWSGLFDESTRPDVIFVGGWPFFAAIPFFRTVCAQVVFMDYGAVPLDGYKDGTLLTQQKLRQLRCDFLPHATQIIAISDFIRLSQSVVDAPLVPAETFLLGADHMDNGLWKAGQVAGAESGKLAEINRLKASGRPVLLCLGRWETGCYKNSDQAFDLLRAIRRKIPGTAMAVLSDSSLSIPADLDDAILPLGFPDDAELAAIMHGSDLGVSLSLWEGFNLPLAEMQWLNRPVLVFDLAAHPEVTLHPWYLCKDLQEMIDKSLAILSGYGLYETIRAEALERFQQKFRWDRMVGQFHQLILDSRDRRVHLILDVTNSSRDPANSGVIRVTRQFGRALQKCEDPLFVVWDEQINCYVLPTREEFAQLGQFHGPVLTSEERLSPSASERTRLEQALDRFGRRDPWMLFSETMMEERWRLIRPHVRSLGLRMAVIFYDAIPVLRPDLCNEEMTTNHRNYMIGLAECDVAVPISHYSGRCLAEFWQKEQVDGCPISVDVLPGEFGVSERGDLSIPQSSPIQILCVSTLEPRKNHRRLVESCLLLGKNHPEVDWVLNLVGNKYAGAFEIADWIQEVSRQSPRVRWFGIVDDPTLQKLYAEAAFTVYPSVIEGFGLPILESMWHGRPCICSADGVMGELAQDGGCLTTDVQNVEALSEAIATLARDHGLREDLSGRAVRCKLKTWREYVQEFLDALKKTPLKAQTISYSADRPAQPVVPWTNLLYPSCILEHWQMFDGERLALTGVLARHRPHCSIEIGTFYGGSLSLLSQYSDIVFSIDIDPQSASRASHLTNVTFLTGSSSDILPILFREVASAGLHVDFILIDGDHSAEGIKRDLGLILQLVPSKPLFIAMHDSFNPNCRQGMLDSPWNECPYCHWVELDFVPGRAIDNNETAKGELWGGLALAYLAPTPRNGPLIIGRSAESLFRTMHEHSSRELATAR
jgi:glycosyltransferase involved in cell wall biosynthesis